MIEENIVKKACTDLGITQRELAEIMKVNEVTVRQWSSKGNIPDIAIEFISLLIENLSLKKDLKAIIKGHEVLNKLAVQNLDI